MNISWWFCELYKSDKDREQIGNCRKGKVNENNGTKTILIKINSNVIRNCEIIKFFFLGGEL